MKALLKAPGANPAPANADAAPSASDASNLRSRLERLEDLESRALRDEWRRLCRSEPPRISRDLLMRALAYRLQELAFGGLPKWARESLGGSVAGIDPIEAADGPKPKLALPILKPGARLVREWHSRIHTIAVLDDAFEFEGRRYRSLTAIARGITGAHWSGPRFFGLTKPRVGTEMAPLPIDTADGAERGGPSPPTQSESSIAARPQISGGPSARGNGGEGHQKERADG